MNHQHSSHYAAHQHADHLGNKPNAISATLTTTASGNETPGYPRVNSVPPRSLNCNGGYPGLNEYGGNSSNSSTNTQNVTNTSTSQSSQMQPPLTQSPGRQPPSRPNSTSNMYQQQQSPGHYNSNVQHMSPRSQTHSPLNQQTMNGGSANQHYQQPNRMQTPTSHNQVDGQQDWNQNSWNSDQQQTSELFNQSERINLNTRLKTMILNKNEKDQQQSSSNHFLSYSHQHLPEQQQQRNDKNINNIDELKLNANESKLSDSVDVGGSETNDPWKSSTTKLKRDKNKSNEFFPKKQQSTESDSYDTTSCAKEAQKNIGKSPEKENESKAAEQETSSFNNCVGNLFDQHQINKNVSKQETGNESEREKQSYSYHSAYEYQQHKNMVNNIKKEPSEDNATGNVKFEGYEKNYQNFIRYADFCDAQQPQYENHQKNPLFQQEYAQPQGYYNNYHYQNYVQPSQTYSQSHSQSYQQFMSQQAAYQQNAHQQQVHQHPHPNASLTNFEQQIPLHTYPIPKHTTGSGETALPSSTNIKIEPVFSNPLNPSSLMCENSPRIEKDDSKSYSNDSPYNVLPNKEEVMSYMKYV